MSQNLDSTTNTKAIIAIISVWFVSVVGLIFEYLALREIKATGQSGRGMALTAVVAGWVFLVLSIVAAIVWSLALVALVAYQPGA